MTQWWRLLYDAGHKPVTRWLSSHGQVDAVQFVGTDHLGRQVKWSSHGNWMLQAIDELPPKQQREREEALDDG